MAFASLTGGRVEDHVEIIEARGAGAFFIRCPGIASHTTATARRDTLLFVDGAPTITCVHQSCLDAVATKNLELRKAFPSGRTAVVPVRHHFQERALQSAANAVRADQAKRLCANIIATFPWCRADIWNDSPLKFDEETSLDETRTFLRSAYEVEDLLWIGEPTNSNEPGAVRSVDDWLTDPNILARPSICPNPLRDQATGRRNANIESVRFVVFEADALHSDPDQNQDRCGALFRWLRDVVSLHLFAVVMSGNKSLHGWFVADDRLREFAACKEAGPLLGTIGFDPAAVRPSQAFRFPGHFRKDKGRIQTLLYLDPAAGATAAGSASKCDPLRRERTDEE